MKILRCQIRVGLPSMDPYVTTDTFVEGQVDTPRTAATLIAEKLAQIRDDATFIDVRATVTDR